MPTQTFPDVPQPSDPISSWETYLRHCFAMKSGCRVRLSRLRETPLERERYFLSRLSQQARSQFHSQRISQLIHPLQKQMLDLMQLRRTLLPEHDPNWNQSEVFLAVGKLHRSLQRLLDQIEHLPVVSNLAIRQWDQLTSVLSLLARGGEVGTETVQLIVQQIRSVAADATIDPLEWIPLCHWLAEKSTQPMTVSERQAICSGLQTAYLAARLLRQKIWFLNADQVLAACLLKDTATLFPGFEALPTNLGHASEWSAGLVSNLYEQGAGVARLIRQHHECLDGSGLPFGMRAGQLTSDARLLAVVTRWAELYRSQQQVTATSVLNPSFETFQQACEILEAEGEQGRWDSLWITSLHQTLGLISPARESTPVAFSGNANPHWKIPRPHYFRKKLVDFSSKPPKPHMVIQPHPVRPETLITKSNPASMFD